MIEALLLARRAAQPSADLLERLDRVEKYLLAGFAEPDKKEAKFSKALQWMARALACARATPELTLPAVPFLDRLWRLTEVEITARPVPAKPPSDVPQATLPPAPTPVSAPAPVTRAASAEPTTLPDSLPREIAEEHFEEAAFYWRQWEEACGSSRYTLDDVADGPEEDLLAHLDGLVAGGRPIAEDLLAPALEDDDPERVRVAAWALLAAEGADYLEVVLRRFLSAPPEVSTSLAGALALHRHPALASGLVALFERAPAQLRGLAFDVLARLDPDRAARLLPASLPTSDLTSLVACLRLLRRLPVAEGRRYLPQVDSALDHPDGTVREEAMQTALAFSSRAVWDAARRVATGAEPSRLAYAAMAMSPRPEDRAHLFDGVPKPLTSRHAVWALGVLADLDAADAAAGLLGDGNLGPLAAEALGAITGLQIEGSFRETGVTQGPTDDDEVDLDAPPPVVTPESFLPPPAVPVVATWWRENRGRFRPDRRYVLGAERDERTLRGSLGRIAMWRRPAIALELAATFNRPMPCNLFAWARDQRRELTRQEA